MTLPGWLSPLPDAEQMRAVDRWAIDERDIPSLELMERAGAGLARLVTDRAPQGRIAVVCGKGNNGGDGLVAARLLREQDREVDVLCAVAPEELEGDVRASLERLPGAPPVLFLAAALTEADVIVDALLGTGFAGEPREPMTGAIEAMNAAAAPIVAADVPSGVDASSGSVAGVAVRAEATATFHRAKPGLHIAPGKFCAGEVRTIDIGIPDDAPLAAQIGLIEDGVVDLVPRRGPQSTKFSEGAVLVAGGSRGLTGAPSLACEAAARAGAGYVTACVPASVSFVFELRLLEVMTRALLDADGALGRRALNALLEATGRADALVLGPGLGRAEETQSFARSAAAQVEVALVLDADGLNAHAGRLADLASRCAPTVLTPHAGELGRLLDVASKEVEAARLHHARAAAVAARSVVVLKGDDTLVADPDGRVAVSAGGASALATAGTGDVLSGITGAMLAKGLEPFEAACAAVHLHAAAGRRAAEGHGGPDGVIARDVIEAIPFALGERD